MKTSFLPAGVALATCAASLLIPVGATLSSAGLGVEPTWRIDAQRRP